MAWTGNKKAFCVLEFAKTESIVMVQRRFRTVYDTEPPTDKATREWYTKFQQSVCLCAAKRTSRLGPSAETVERVRGTLVRSPKKSTHRANRELQMTQSSVWRILRERLRVKGYRLQLLQALNPQDHNLRFHICVDFQQRLDEDGLLRSWFSVTRQRFMCVVRSQLTQFWQIPRHRTLSYSLSTPCFFTTAP